MMDNCPHRYFDKKARNGTFFNTKAKRAKRKAPVPSSETSRTPEGAEGGSAGTDRPLLLIDQVIHVAVGEDWVHRDTSCWDFSSICARRRESARKPAKKNFGRKGRQGLTTEGGCGILMLADIRRCGGIGRHKGLKIPR